MKTGLKSHRMFKCCNHFLFYFFSIGERVVLGSNVKLFWSTNIAVYIRVCVCVFSPGNQIINVCVAPSHCLLNCFSVHLSILLITNSYLSLRVFAKRWILTHHLVGERRKVQSSKIGWRKKMTQGLGRDSHADPTEHLGLTNGGVVINNGHTHKSTEIYFSLYETKKWIVGPRLCLKF